MRRIFLSYGRGDDGEPFNPDASFPARLCRDLTARGFDVWFDRVSMPSRRLTFHQEIRDAVAACERLLLIVGPHAARSDYVRQEWQFAWFDVEKLVTPILRIGDYALVPDELKLLHCEDFRNDADYPFHLDQLVRILNDPPPPLGKLIAVPALPAHYLTRADRLIPLRDAVRSGLDSPAPFGGTVVHQRLHGIVGTARHVGMHGMGGIGKSVLANLLARDRKVREAFPDGIVWVGLGSLPDLRARMQEAHLALGGDGAIATEHEAKEKLKTLLSDRAVLLVLDDAWRKADVDAFDVLGPRCRALITTRDAGLLTSVGGTQHVVELLTDEEALRLLAAAVGQAPEQLPAEAGAVLKECGRLPLAVALAGGMVAAGAPWADLLDALREHELEFLEDPHAAGEQHRNLWKMIEVSVQALPADKQERLAELAVFLPDESVPDAAVATLWQYAGELSPRNSRKLLVELQQRSLVQLTRSAETPAGSVGDLSLHDLIHDYCVRRALQKFGDEKAIHERLLDAYRAQCADGWHAGPNDGYFFTHLRDHLHAAGRAQELAELLRDHRWLEAKNAAGLVFDLPEDFSAALGSMRIGDASARFLELLDEALRRDISFVHRHHKDYPQGLFQCVWNSSWWYDCPEAAQHYVEGRAPGQDAGAGLSRWLESWRAQKERTTPGFAWLRSLRPPVLHLGTALKAIFRGHEGGVTSVAWSPDGTRLATGSLDKTVRLWDAATGQELACLRGHEEAVGSVAWSPDGRRLASGSLDKTVRLWDAATGQELACLRGHEKGVGDVAWSRNGRRLASDSRDGTVRLWDVATGVEAACLRGHEDSGMSVAWSPDSARLATGAQLATGPDKTMRLWDAATGEELCCLRGHEGSVMSEAWSPDGTRLATGSSDKTVRLWDAATGVEMACLRGHDSAVLSVAWSPDGTRVASASHDKTVRLWDAATGHEVCCLRGHEDEVERVVWSPDGTRLASSSWNTVRLWDADRGAGLAWLRGHEDRVEDLAWSPEGARLATGSSDRTVRLWDPAASGDLACLRGHEAWVRNVACSLDGTRMASAGDRTVRVWDVATGIELACLRGHENGMMSVAWSPEGARLASGSFDNTVRLWDAVTGQELKCLRGHKEGVGSVAWSPDGQRIASGSYDNTVRVWDANTGAELCCLHGHQSYVERLAWSPDGQRLASGSDDKTVRLWDPATGAGIWCLQGHENLVWSLAWSPDGKRVASGSDDQTVRIWDVATGECLEVRHGSAAVVAFAGSAKRRRFIGWTERLQTRIETVGPHAVAWFPDAVRCLVALPDGRTWAGAVANYLCLFTLEGPSGDGGAT